MDLDVLKNRMSSRKGSEWIPLRALLEPYTCPKVSQERRKRPPNSTPKFILRNLTSLTLHSSSPRDTLRISPPSSTHFYELLGGSHRGRDSAPRRSDDPDRSETGDAL